MATLPIASCLAGHYFFDVMPHLLVLDHFGMSSLQDRTTTFRVLVLGYDPPIIATALWLTKDDTVNTTQKLRTFDLIRHAVLPEFRDRVAEYLCFYEEVLHDENVRSEDLRASANQLRGYLRGLNTTRVLGMADLEELDRRVVESWL